MKLMNVDRIIPSLEITMKISLGLMESIGLKSTDDYYKGVESTYLSIIEAFKKQEKFVDAVPVKVIESWLYSIALNNTDNALGEACEEIIKRLDGLVRYNADLNDGEPDD